MFFYPFKAGGASSDDASMKKSIEEIKKLQEEISALRQENIQLKVCMILPIRVCWYFVSKHYAYLSVKPSSLAKTNS